MNKFYLTTAIPYVNGKPHIGHALEYFQADTVRRFQQMLGKKTLLLSGADENALKNVQTAEKEGIPVQEFLDKNSTIFKNAFEELGVHLDIFQRGSDQKKHWLGVQELWRRCDKKGDIYKKSYTGFYCVGCESFKTEKELVGGKCPDHQKEPEKVTEENYFFRLSKYQDEILNLIESDKLSIIPENKKSEIISFIKSGLEDFSISRTKERAKGVGVPVPGDDKQIIYVWFDALAIYLTGIGFGVNDEWETWWPANLHIIGKDINRFHTVYWPAMLLSAGLPTPKQILIHGFITSNGEKMSKSIGNVIDPFEMVEKYGLEAFRYYLLSQIPTSSDGDFTFERFEQVYNSDLANELGNLVARTARLCESHTIKFSKPSEFDKGVKETLNIYEFQNGLLQIWEKVKKLNQTLNTDEPWKITDQNRLEERLTEYVNILLGISYNLKPFLPQTSEKIAEIFTQSAATKQKVLFPKIS